MFSDSDCQIELDIDAERQILREERERLENERKELENERKELEKEKQEVNSIKNILLLDSKNKLNNLYVFCIEHKELISSDSFKNFKRINTNTKDIKYKSVTEKAEDGSYKVFIEAI